MLAAVAAKLVVLVTGKLNGLTISPRRHDLNPYLQGSELDQELTWNAKLVLEVARLLKHLDTMVVGVSHDNVFIHAKTEPVWRIELALPRAKLTKLAPIQNLYMNSQHYDNSHTALILSGNTCYA